MLPLSERDPANNVSAEQQAMTLLLSTAELSHLLGIYRAEMEDLHAKANCLDPEQAITTLLSSLGAWSLQPELKFSKIRRWMQGFFSASLQGVKLPRELQRAQVPSEAPRQRFTEADYRRGVEAHEKRKRQTAWEEEDLTKKRAREKSEEVKVTVVEGTGKRARLNMMSSSPKLGESLALLSPTLANPSISSSNATLLCPSRARWRDDRGWQQQQRLRLFRFGGESEAW